MDILTDMPEEWKHDIDLVVNPGRDDRGDIVPGTRQRVKGCLLAVSDVSEFDNLNSGTNVKAKVFIPTDVDIKPTDQVITYSPAAVIGRWAVKGPAIRWPLGTEVRLEWEARSE